MQQHKTGKIPKTSRIAGYYHTYDAAYQSVSKRHKENRTFSIQRNDSLSSWRGWVLIYYGIFW